MRLMFRYDREKAVAAILYIADKLIKKLPNQKADYYKILKVIYFAERKHLVRYAQPMIGDIYSALPHGPVPDNTYGLIKMVSEKFEVPDCYGLSKLFSIHGNYVVPLQEPDMDEFSESDIECLDESIDENLNLNFNQLRDKSHTKVYEHVDRSDLIPILEIVKEAGADENTLKALEEYSQNERILT